MHVMHLNPDCIFYHSHGKEHGKGHHRTVNRIRMTLHEWINEWITDQSEAHRGRSPSTNTHIQVIIQKTIGSQGCFRVLAHHAGWILTGAVKSNNQKNKFPISINLVHLNPDCIFLQPRVRAWEGHVMSVAWHAHVKGHHGTVNRIRMSLHEWINVWITYQGEARRARSPPTNTHIQVIIQKTIGSQGCFRVLPLCWILTAAVKYREWLVCWEFWVMISFFHVFSISVCLYA